ncbi:MAG: response regulator [Deltaproteobacteria bacterium]|nr:response regulator [Deltaproteobacteria bacterium]
MATSITTAPVKKKILVIDDEPIIRQVLTLHLRSAGYDVVCAENATDGIGLAGSGSFSLVITDYNLPDLNGLDVMTAVKAGEPGLPVMVISGFLDAELVSKVIKAGAVQYLKKPFLKAAVLATVANILRAGEDA